MRRAARRDATHAEVRDGWRAIAGAPNVRDTGSLGGDFPDLVIGFRGLTFMFEVKSGAKAKLRPGQAAAMAAWRGGPWLRVDSFPDSVAKANEELTRRGMTPLGIGHTIKA